MVINDPASMAEPNSTFAEHEQALLYLIANRAPGLRSINGGLLKLFKLKRAARWRHGGVA